MKIRMGSYLVFPFLLILILMLFPMLSGCLIPVPIPVNTGTASGVLSAKGDGTAADETTQRYKDIDRRAVRAPSSAELSVEKLGSYLASLGATDGEKARAVYRWVTENIAYDTEGFLKGSYGDSSAEGVLKNGKSVCEGYANLFKALCDEAGVETVKVSGISKGYGYGVGQYLDEPNHAWNAVRINGRWHLVDSTWGAGYIGQSGRFVRAFQSHYFLTPPEKFILDHYPTNERWQLLSTPVSLDAFNSYANVKPAFHRNGLMLLDNAGTIESEGDEVRVGMHAEKDVQFMVQLFMDGGEVKDYKARVEQGSGGRFDMVVVLSEPGEFHLRLFVKTGGSVVSAVFEEALNCMLVRK